MHRSSPSRPIWEILVISAESSGGSTLDCDECFTILELLAVEAMEGVEEEILRQAVYRHLSDCPDCWEHHKQRLKELEDMLAGRKERIRQRQATEFSR